MENVYHKVNKKQCGYVYSNSETTLLLSISIRKDFSKQYTCTATRGFSATAKVPVEVVQCFKGVASTHYACIIQYARIDL